MILCLLGVIIRDSSIFSRVSYTNAHYSFIYCLFDFCSNSNHGGAVYFSGSGYNLGFECCRFDYCTSKLQGGALFIDQARLSKIVKSIMQNCSASGSSSYRIGMSSRSVLYDEMTDFSESHSYSNGHGSLHGCSYLTYKNNNHTYSRSASTTYGESIFSCLNGYSFSFSNFAHDTTSNYLCSWNDMNEFKYLNDNFINISCTNFIYRVSTSSTGIFDSCYFQNFSYVSLSSHKIVKITNCYFDVESMTTSQCLVFSNNIMNTQLINIHDCKAICYLTSTYRSFKFHSFLISTIIYVSDYY